MSVQKLSPAAIEEELAKLPDWGLDQHKLYRHFVFTSFIEAFGFISQVALLAEAQNHHPEWTNTYDRVEIYLTTHEAGGISQRDFELAKCIDSLV